MGCGCNERTDRSSDRTGASLGIGTNTESWLSGKALDEEKNEKDKIESHFIFYPAKDNQQEMLENLRNLFQKRSNGNKAASYFRRNQEPDSIGI